MLAITSTPVSSTFEMSASPIVMGAEAVMCRRVSIASA